MPLPTIGARIDYTGDAANVGGRGTIVEHFPGDMYQHVGARLVLDDGRDFRRLGPIVFEKQSGQRFHALPVEPYPADAVAFILNAANARKVAKDLAELQEKEAAKARHARGVILAARLIPAECPAVIVARLQVDKSESQADYHGHTIAARVVLALSTNTRDNFKEFRNAAKRFKPCASLVAGGVEHREKYSMGAGYFLSTSDRSHGDGWTIRKERTPLNYENLESLAIGHCLPLVAEVVER